MHVPALSSCKRTWCMVSFRKTWAGILACGALFLACLGCWADPGKPGGVAGTDAGAGPVPARTEAIEIEDPQVPMALGPDEMFCLEGFSDVPREHAYFKEIDELRDEGVLTGSGSQAFCPDRAITGRELAAMLSRADGLSASWATLFDDLADQDWYDNSLADYGDAKIPASLAKLAMYRQAGLEIYNENAYDLETMMSRGEAAYFLCRVRRFAALGLDFEYEDGYAATAQSVRETMIRDLPLEISTTMAELDWSVEVGAGYIGNYMAEHGTSNIVGLCSYKNKTVYVLTPMAIIHESGHFADKLMWGYQGRDELFAAEGEACGKYISTYGAKNPAEFMAEIFTHYLSYRSDPEGMARFRERMPLSYECMRTREDNGWFAPSAG